MVRPIFLQKFHRSYYLVKDRIERSSWDFFVVFDNFSQRLGSLKIFRQHVDLFFDRLIALRNHRHYILVLRQKSKFIQMLLDILGYCCIFGSFEYILWRSRIGIFNSFDPKSGKCILWGSVYWVLDSGR